jgi:MtaA/CmuA family methyltransferase
MDKEKSFSMTPYERVFNRLQSKAVDKIPNLNILMAFAAKYIGVPYSRYATDYRCLVEGNIACCEKFGIDMVSTISDPCREVHGFGAHVLFPEDDIPMCKDFLLKDYSDLKNLHVKDPLKCERMLDRIKAVELYKKSVGGKYPILGWVEGAFAEANDLRGMTELMMDAYDEPDFVRELLEICNEQAIAFAKEQIRAGADIIGIGDAAASLVGPALYQSIVLPAEQKLISEIHGAGAKARLHICGNITSLISYVPLSGADIIDVDWKVDFGAAVKAFGTSCCACGNFDPVSVLLAGTPESVGDAVKGCVKSAHNNTFIAAGCEVPRETPHENLMRVKDTLEELA